MRRYYAAAGIVCLLVLVLAATAQSVTRDGDQNSERTDITSSSSLQFEYQLGLLDDAERRYLSQPTTLPSGQRFTVRMRAPRRVYAYLFASNTGGGYTLMGPYGGDKGAATVVTGNQWTVLPDDDAVFRLDERQGVERLYLIVGNEPVDPIEDLRADSSVQERWLVELRGRLTTRSLWKLEQQATSTRATYTGPAASLIAVEDLVFGHR